MVRLEARAPNAEGTGEVTIRELVVNALRMRPCLLYTSADAGLSVAQFLGGGLEAAEARHCEERVVFLVGHKAPPGVRISLLCVVRLHNYKTFLKCFTRSLVLLFSARSLV